MRRRRRQRTCREGRSVHGEAFHGTGDAEEDAGGNAVAGMPNLLLPAGCIGRAGAKDDGAEAAAVVGGPDTVSCCVDDQLEWRGADVFAACGLRIFGVCSSAR